MNPLIFGYMRVPPDMSDDEAKRKEHDMEAYAQAEGLTLGTVFHELLPNQRSAFDELVAALRRAESHHVVVPSYRDLALTERLQNALLLQIELQTGATVVALDES
ncbi:MULTISPECIES: recombinase family protein [Streptomyces]|uniref:Recombinase family protein n=1 Tax=Streptomyces lichenis TaxID=2306967 RepID=A0ABT0I5N5_9ACTN|nr:recombinase family protein [Streptomyces lichenis]MCK8676622.1 recombinase family protein [Streptomyces lichenis]